MHALQTASVCLKTILRLILPLFHYRLPLNILSSVSTYKPDKSHFLHYVLTVQRCLLVPLYRSYPKAKESKSLSVFTVQRPAGNRCFYAGETCAFRGMTDEGRRLVASTRSSGRRARVGSREDLVDDRWSRDGGGTRPGWRERSHHRPAGRRRAVADVEPESKFPTKSHRTTIRQTWSTSRPVDFHPTTVIVPITEWLVNCTKAGNVVMNFAAV